LFDVAFSELVVIAIIALVIIGPEKLPRVARTLGAITGRLQRYVTTIKADVEREMQLEELQKVQQEIRRNANQIQAELNLGTQQPIAHDPKTELPPQK
jgi:sec-independent protein translocase protein TatB